MENKKSLLEKALSRPRNKRIRFADEEHIELALAWVRGDISLAQVGEALYGEKNAAANGKGSHSYVHLASALKTYIRQLEGLNTDPLRYQENTEQVWNPKTKRFDLVKIKP